MDAWMRRRLFFIQKINAGVNELRVLIEEEKETKKFLKSKEEEIKSLFDNED